MARVGVNRDFWRRRRVLITGHTGFKGAWLILLLRQLGADVHGFSLPPPTTPSMFDVLSLADQCSTHVTGDVRELRQVEQAVAVAAPEVVIHMAAQPLVRLSYDEPVETYAVNVMGTVHVMEACRRSDTVRAAIMVTTDKCYENVGWAWGYRENDRLGGADPYSNSKAACELAIDAYRRSFCSDGEKRHLGLASARAGNVIGGGDFALDRLIPDAMRAFMAGEPLHIRNSQSIRPWQHVLDALTGYLLLCERLHHDLYFAQGWNFGPQPDESASVSEVASTLQMIWGDGAQWTQEQSDTLPEAATLKLDSTKARMELGWKPRFDLVEALAISAEWFKAYNRGDDMLEVTQRQIVEYAA